MKNLLRPEKILLAFGLFFGLIFLFLTPPFQVADEGVHFFRAYQTAQGELVDPTIPSSAVATAAKFNHLPFHPEQKTSFVEIFSLLGLPLEPQNTQKIPSIAYPPLAYLPQALGIRIGIFFELSPLSLMYLGRLFNLMVWLTLAGLAVRRTPIFKWLLCLLALSPMSLFEAASLSKDPLINGASFLLIASYFDAAFGARQRLRNRDLLGLFLLLLLASLPKSVYAVLGLLFLAVPIAKVGSRKKYFGYFFLTMALLFAILLLGNYFFFHARPPSQDFVEWRGRLHFILGHPMGFLEILARTLLKNGGEYLEMFVGVLGWLDTVLPEPVWIFYGVVSVVVALLEKDPDISVPRRAKLISLAALSLGILAIMTTIYLALPPQNGLIAGVQGRYFIPLAPLFFLSLYNRRIRVDSDFGGTLGKLVVLTASIALIAASHAVYSRYYL